LSVAWPQEDLSRIEITLFDLDREALEHAQSCIYENAVRTGKNPKLNFIKKSVRAYLAGASKAREMHDLIYSGGLFDYLDNVTSAALVRVFAKMLNPGGSLVIGNFTKDNTTKAFCHLITNWNLIHKTETDMRNWATGVDGCTLRIDYDPGRINAFFVLTNKGQS
jgi:extracellular factor (EF) 3-hydroxypalmitic acid methyl ester biosynthesis protein